LRLELMLPRMVRVSACGKGAVVGGGDRNARQEARRLLRGGGRLRRTDEGRVAARRHSLQPNVPTARVRSFPLPRSKLCAVGLESDRIDY